MICFLLVIIIICIFFIIKRSRERYQNITIASTWKGGAKSKSKKIKKIKKLTRKGGSIVTKQIEYLQKNDFQFLYRNVWRVTLFFLNIRYIFNKLCSKVMNIRESIFKITPADDDASSSLKRDYSLSKDELYRLLQTDPLKINNINRKFEGFFYTLVGSMNNIIELFPFGNDLTEEKFNKIMKDQKYYDTNNACYDPFKLRFDEDIEKLKKMPDIVEKLLQILINHQLITEKSQQYLDIKSIEDFESYIHKLFHDSVKEVIVIYNKLINYDISPVVNGSIFSLNNPRKDIRYSNSKIIYDIPYPELFKKINKVNTKLNKSMNIDDLLGIITVTHMPVFTNNGFTQDTVDTIKFTISRSPGLMTASVPSVSEKMRLLDWVIAKDKRVIFYDDDKGVPNYFLEAYSSPLNHVAEIFCSLFPTDMLVNGCIGRFDEQICSRFEEYDWVPKIMMVNPPYTNDIIRRSNVISDIVHSKYSNISIITMSRRDNALFEPLLPYGDVEVQVGLSGIIIKDIVESPYLVAILIIPEELFTYRDMLTLKDFTSASRKGQRPTDTLAIIKSTDPDPSHVQEVKQLWINSTPKNHDRYYISENRHESIIDNLSKRRDALGIDPKIMNKKFMQNMIHDFNKLVSE